MVAWGEEGEEGEGGVVVMEEDSEEGKGSRSPMVRQGSSSLGIPCLVTKLKMLVESNERKKETDQDSRHRYTVNPNISLTGAAFNSLQAITFNHSFVSERSKYSTNVPREGLGWTVLKGRIIVGAE